MDIHLNVEQLFFPGTDDGFFGPINIPSGLPFGDSVQTDLYVRKLNGTELSVILY